jgi:hypothetical protein
MAQLRDLKHLTTTFPGRRLLRFTTVIVNVGAGPFEIIGCHPNTGSTPPSVDSGLAVLQSGESAT